MTPAPLRRLDSRASAEVPTLTIKAVPFLDAGEEPPRRWMRANRERAVHGRAIHAASFTTPGDRPNKLKMMMRYLKRPKIDPLLLPNSNKSVIGFNLIWLYAQIEKFEEILSALEELKLPAPIIGESYPFDKLPDAIRKLQSGMTVGKVVVEV